MNSSGNIVEEYNYDPCLSAEVLKIGTKVEGSRRKPSDWSYSNVATPTYTQHGFTGHACSPKLWLRDFQ